MKMNPRCLYVLALTLTALSITGCSGGSSSSTTPPAIQKQTVEKYPVSGIMKETDGYTLAGTVSISATDKNGAAVKLYSDKTGGHQITTVTVGTDGLISFFVDGNALLPVTVKAVGNADQLTHIANSAVFTIDKAGSSYFTINVVDASTALHGSTSGTGTGTLDLDDIIVNVTAPNHNPVMVDIPGGTVLKAGTTALSGSLTATVTTFSTPTATNPILAPELLDSTLANSCDPSSADPALNDTNCTVPGADLENFPGSGGSNLITAGFVSVRVTDPSGNLATSSSNPFTIHMDIQAGTINPLTDLPVAVGDSIPIWTYNELEATWKPELDSNGNQVVVIVQQNAVTGALFVEHTSKHFSFWSLGWAVGPTCTGTLNLTGDAVVLPLTLKATLSKGAGFLLVGYKPSGDATVTATGIPANKQIDLVLMDPSSKVVASKKKFVWCTTTTSTPITLNYTAPATKTPVPVTVTVSEYCSQAPAVTRVVPSALTSVARVGSLLPVSIGTTDTTGAFVHYLIGGISYNFSAYNRTTGTFVIKNNIAVKKNTPQTVAFSTPVTCKPVISGSTGGTGGYTF